MNTEKEQFLNLKTSPARLTVEQAAWYLGFSPHEIPILVSEGLLKPLGHPAQNAPKFFAFANLEEFRRDVKWLAKPATLSAIIGDTGTTAIPKATAPRQKWVPEITDAGKALFLADGF